ncbi:Uncharacterised protein [Nocardia farcinica]|uniref:Uncharacterized protein n=1 Tax=Nocardia farcinica TaxID=37329 RepID=A0A449G7V3_NOCFR|nr:Uncharacterised protein [Nocardia farcinica]
MCANRSRQAQKLAGLLTARTHTKVRLDYHDAVTGGRCWHIKWTDGLSWRKMLAVAAELSDEVPSMDITQMRPARAATPLAEAAAVLVWLNDDEDRADFPRWSGRSTPTTRTATRNGSPTAGASAVKRCCH